MRKIQRMFMAVLVAVCALACGTGTASGDAADDGGQYYLGGIAAGFSLSAGGAEIIGFKEIAANGNCGCPASEAGLQVGDTIVAVDGIAVQSVQDLNAALERSRGSEIRVLVRRGKGRAEVTVRPVYDRTAERYKIGVLIRDTLSGIGTVTYIRCDTLRFGSLGHEVCDDAKAPMQIADASVYLCSVVGVNRGERGRAGELRGLFLNDGPIATADRVCDAGLYGQFSREYDFSDWQTVETAPLSRATIGKAVIYSTVDGTQPQAYDIAIAKVDAGNRNNKNFVIKVTDERLIRETGGIVQGMSGSPIVQNGKLIGAITHVFLNDPTRGYGIGIEKMLDN